MHLVQINSKPERLSYIKILILFEITYKDVINIGTVSETLGNQKCIVSYTSKATFIKY